MGSQNWCSSGLPGRMWQLSQHQHLAAGGRQVGHLHRLRSDLRSRLQEEWRQGRKLPPLPAAQLIFRDGGETLWKEDGLILCDLSGPMFVSLLAEAQGDPISSLSLPPTLLLSVGSSKLQHPVMTKSCTACCAHQASSKSSASLTRR